VEELQLWFVDGHGCETLSSLTELVTFSDQRVSSSLYPKEFESNVRSRPASSNQLLVMRRLIATGVQLQRSLSGHVSVGESGGGALEVEHLECWAYIGGTGMTWASNKLSKTTGPQFEWNTSRHIESCFWEFVSSADHIRLVNNQLTIF